MKIAEFDYELPPQLIAQSPAAVRDQSRLMVVERATGHKRELPANDLLGALLPSLQTQRRGLEI